MKLLNNEQPVINGTGEQTRDFVYVKDVAKANLLALKNDLIGAVNISTGREISINETFSLLKKVTGSRLSEKHGPALPGEQLRSVLSYEQAKQHISWSPTISFEEGLKETVDFFYNK
jgi:UDP-glucose 4-epimerase